MEVWNKQWVSIEAVGYREAIGVVKSKSSADKLKNQMRRIAFPCRAKVRNQREKGDFFG
jgi:hypothetical protein